MVNDYLHEDIHSLFYLIVIWCIRWPGIGGLNLKVARVALLNCLFVSGRLQNSSEKHFGMRTVILCPEKWDNVPPRNCWEWKRGVSSAGWAFSLSARGRHLLTVTCTTERDPGQGWALRVSVLSRFQKPSYWMDWKKCKKNTLGCKVKIAGFVARNVLAVQACFSGADSSSYKWTCLIY